jgi:hypothetical protein
MAGERSLWERLTGKNAPVSAEQRYYNPFGLTMGHRFRIDFLGLRETLFQLVALEEWDRGTQPMADYRLSRREFNGEETRTYVLRAVPREGAPVGNRLPFVVVGLEPFYECPADDSAVAGLLQGVNDPAGEFVVNPGSHDEKRYRRVGGPSKPPTQARATLLKDRDGDGFINDRELTSRRVEYWDFLRPASDKKEGNYDEYLVVQRDLTTGGFEVLIGPEIPPERILL